MYKTIVLLKLRISEIKIQVVDFSTFVEIETLAFIFDKPGMLSLSTNHTIYLKASFSVRCMIFSELFIINHII